MTHRNPRNNHPRRHGVQSVVCGLHRSGTTYVGAILNKAGACVVHEPLNQHFGMRGVPIAYPYAARRDDQYANLIDAALGMARPWSRNASFIEGSMRARLVYALTGGRNGLRWSLLRLRRGLRWPHQAVCMKDPFMSLAAPYLVRERGIRVVCLVRHPAAIYLSTVRLKWRFDIANLRHQYDLMARHGNAIAPAYWRLAERSHAAAIALLWRLMIMVNQPLCDTDDRFLVVRHEELCFRPWRTVREICGHVGLIPDKRLETYVIEQSQGDSIEARQGSVHDFLRDSRALANAWREGINSNDLQLIRDVAGPELEAVYPADAAVARAASVRAAGMRDSRPSGGWQ